MLSLWSLMHGTAMLMIRGGVSGVLSRQMTHACLDALEAIVGEAKRSKGKVFSGPKWPSGLILGEATRSKVHLKAGTARTKSSKRRRLSKGRTAA